jgi:hypothetical protein
MSDTRTPTSTSTLYGNGAADDTLAYGVDQDGTHGTTSTLAGARPVLTGRHRGWALLWRDPILLFWVVAVGAVAAVGAAAWMAAPDTSAAVPVDARQEAAVSAYRSVSFDLVAGDLTRVKQRNRVVDAVVAETSVAAGAATGPLATAWDAAHDAAAEFRAAGTTQEARAAAAAMVDAGDRLALVLLTGSDIPRLGGVVPDSAPDPTFVPPTTGPLTVDGPPPYTFAPAGE